MNSFQAAKFSLFCTFAALLLNGFLVGAQQFVFPTNNENKFGNRSQSVDFIWRYTTPDITQTMVYCGISKQNVVYKATNAAAVIVQGFIGRAVAIEESTAPPYSIGFTLNRLDFSDANDYTCTLSYPTTAPIFSSTYKFGIYEPPQFARCLEDGLVSGASGARYFALREGEVLNSTCYVYGNPVPSLDCRTYDVSNIQQQALTPRTRNFTSMPLNERMLFYNVRRPVTKVRCVADGGPTGKKYSEQNVRVDYLPSKPRDVKLVASTPQSIRIAWTLPEQAGLSPITDYFMELFHPNNTLTYRNYTVLSSGNPLLDYTFDNLFASQTYGIQIAAYNSVGMGDRSDRANYKTVFYSGTSPRTDSGLSSGSIVGIVFGVLIAILLVIIVVFFVLKKRRESAKYPQTYVEEAVDYPPTDRGMYAHVKKQKFNSGANDSTSGYPDSTNQAKPPREEEKPMMHRGAPPKDDPQITAYEKSRKEYV